MAESTASPQSPHSGPHPRLVTKHHALVRLTHWVNVPLLLGLIASEPPDYWNERGYSKFDGL